MSDFANVSDPLIDAVVEEFPDDAPSDCVASEERQRTVEKRRTVSWLPEVDSDDDFVVALATAALLR